MNESTLIESARQLIAADSSPGQGSFRIAQVVKEKCTSLGLHVDWLEESSGDLKQVNLLIGSSGEARGSEDFLLQSHLDTADPGPFGIWSKTDFNPFDAHIIDGRIYGLGAADCKLDLLCKMIALSELKNQKYKVRPILAATYGEETGMQGALKLIRKNKIKAKRALIGEPTNLQLFTSGKGFASVEVSLPFESDEKKFRLEHNLSEGTSSHSRLFHGKSAHSSMPQQGESAVKKMFDYLIQLPEDMAVMEIDGGDNPNTIPAQGFLEVDPISGFSFPMAKKLGKVYRTILDLEQIFSGYKDSRFNPDSPTLSIGRVRSTEEEVLIQGNCRMPPIISTEIYEGWMQRLKKVCESVGGQFRVHDYKKPYQTDAVSGFIKDCQALTKNLGFISDLGSHSSTNEASLFSRIGIECVSFGPGERERNMHTPNENVAVEDLFKAIDFYKNAIQRFCL